MLSCRLSSATYVRNEELPVFFVNSFLERIHGFGRLGIRNLARFESMDERGRPPRERACCAGFTTSQYALILRLLKRIDGLRPTLYPTVNLGPLDWLAAFEEGLQVWSG